MTLIHKVCLTNEDRAKLHDLLKVGGHSARAIARGYILLLAHQGKSDDEIAHTLKHRACFSTKGLLAYLAAILLTRFPVAHTIALAHFPSCAAVSVRAKYLRCIPLFCVVFFPIHSVQTNAFLFSSPGPFVTPSILGRGYFLC